GRSMVNVFTAANSLGYLAMRPDTLIEVNQIENYAADQLVLITTGSQGEPMSALTRMAFSEHKRVEILPDDTVILSASPIPGNEKPIYRVINELFKRGAHVIYESLSEIHVSGHAYQEELKLLHSLVKPRFFIPGHGEYRHLYRHAEMAHQLGMPWENIFLLGNGDIFEYKDNQARISGFTNAGGVLIDGSGMVSADDPVLRDRRLMAEDGVVTVFVAVNAANGQMSGDPNVQASGFIYGSEYDRVISECQKKIGQIVRKASGGGKSLTELVRSGVFRDQLRDWLFDRTKRRPIVLVSLIEV
ncbi:MAG TPA: ribonuclease J, partial [Clostridiales bacterium]|nr:ribonuclease J [Clostridiales bacterium]